MKLEFVNIHTHESHNASDIEIINLFPMNAEKIISEAPHNLFSLGLHPWHIDSNSEELLQRVEKLSTCKNVVAIGEIGLDKVCGAEFDKQISVFKAQVKIAVKAQKPIIIHCVKSYSEILAIKREFSTENPIVFHGFRGKPALAEQLLKNGCYLSIGEGALHLKETIKAITLDRLFIETDESKTSITQIYKAVAGIKNISEQQLSEQIQRNFTSVFLKRV